MGTLKRKRQAGMAGDRGLIERSGVADILDTLLSCVADFSRQPPLFSWLVVAGS